MSRDRCVVIELLYYIILYLRVFVLLHTVNQMATKRGVSVGAATDTYLKRYSAEAYRDYKARERERNENIQLIRAVDWIHWSAVLVGFQINKRLENKRFILLCNLSIIKNPFSELTLYRCYICIFLA